MYIKSKSIVKRLTLKKASIWSNTIINNNFIILGIEFIILLVFIYQLLYFINGGVIGKNFTISSKEAWKGWIIIFASTIGAMLGIISSTLMGRAKSIFIIFAILAGLINIMDSFLVGYYLTSIRYLISALIPIIIFGSWRYWIKNKGEVVPRKIKWKWYIIILTTIVIVILSFGYIFKDLINPLLTTKDPYPFVDSTVFIVGIYASGFSLFTTVDAYIFWVIYDILTMTSTILVHVYTSMTVSSMFFILNSLTLLNWIYLRREYQTKNI